MSENDIREYDYTEAAWESLYNVVDDQAFLEQDSQAIYDSLKHRLRFIPFGDYLKRYIYLNARPEKPFTEMELKDYQLIIKDSFSDNFTPPAFTPTTAKLSALSKNWLTQQTVKRNVVFLLGFGLNMSVDDVNLFLTKALREPEINPKNPFEVICWYCYKNKYNYLKFEKLMEQYDATPANYFDIDLIHSERTVSIRKNMHSIHSDDELISHVSKLKTPDNISKISVTARESFNALYDEARDLIAEMYNRSSEEEHLDALMEYKDRLSRSDRLYDYEKIERYEKFRSKKKVYVREDITESDIEQIICAAIPKDRYGNLTPGKASKLNAQFAGKRFSRQHIGEIISGNAEVTRFDLITLNFFVYSQRLDLYPDPKQRFTHFLETTDRILKSCFMGGIYIQNPYECFVLMCILSLDPLGTYADVWELSYQPE
ncbi:MAG: hypothetical protein IJA55_06765 [Clostridia bacterium]|nr:hypothetical protein [Clostridia bacterium]